MRRLFNRCSQVAIAAAPVAAAGCMMAGNLGLMLRHGIHPNLETAVGTLWIASDYALRQKIKHPVAAPRLNAAGVILGSLLLAASGMHMHGTDWHKVKTPLGYIPAALFVGLQNELHREGDRFSASPARLSHFFGAALHHPYAMAAAVNAYGVYELARSALASHDTGLQCISAAYAAATVLLPLLDYQPKNIGRPAGALDLGHAL